MFDPRRNCLHEGVFGGSQAGGVGCGRSRDASRGGSTDLRNLAALDQTLANAFASSSTGSTPSTLAAACAGVELAGRPRSFISIVLERVIAAVPATPANPHVGGLREQAGRAQMEISVPGPELY